jgi:hypothetical protein
MTILRLYISFDCILRSELLLNSNSIPSSIAPSISLRNRSAETTKFLQSGSHHLQPSLITIKQSFAMHSPVRDPMREYQKQQEKLALIEFECIVDWARKSVLARKANVSRLNGELSGLHQYLQPLEDEKKEILDHLSQENAWTDPGNQRQTLKLLEINSK